MLGRPGRTGGRAGEVGPTHRGVRGRRGGHFLNLTDPDEFGLDPDTGVEPYGVAAEAHSSLRMLDLRGHDGTSFALPYARLSTVAFNPAGGITLEFGAHRVHIRGRNLGPLYNRLLAHQVTFVQEGDLDVQSEWATFVDSITVRHAEDAV